MNRILTIAVTTALLTSSGAALADHAKWSGFSIGIGGGGGAVVHDLTAVPGTALPPGSFDFGFDGIGGEGVFGTLSAGLDYQINNRWVIGAFFDYDFSSIDTTINLSVPGFVNASGNI